MLPVRNRTRSVRQLSRLRAIIRHKGPAEAFSRGGMGISVFTVIFFGLALFTLVAAGLGVYGEPRWYWWAALSSYLCSFLGGFSIGLYLLSLTFVLLFLALGHSLRLLRAPWHSACAVGLGLGFWWLAVLKMDDALLYFPFRLLGPWLSGGSSGGGYGSCTEVNGVLKCTQVRY